MEERNIHQSDRVQKSAHDAQLSQVVRGVVEGAAEGQYSRSLGSMRSVERASVAFSWYSMSRTFWELQRVSAPGCNPAALHGRRKEVLRGAAPVVSALP